jgi:hypothetical protein
VLPAVSEKVTVAFVSSHATFTMRISPVATFSSSLVAQELPLGAANRTAELTNVVMAGGAPFSYRAQPPTGNAGHVFSNVAHPLGGQSASGSPH